MLLYRRLRRLLHDLQHQYRLDAEPIISELVRLDGLRDVRWHVAAESGGQRAAEGPPA